MEIVGIEIPVLDLEKGLKFYEKVFDWEFDRKKIPGQGYVLLNDSIGISIFETKKIRPKGFNVGFSVEDLDATLSKIKQESGKIVKDKFNLEGLGSVAVFQDCFGNELSLMSED